MNLNSGTCKPCMDNTVTCSQLCVCLPELFDFVVKLSHDSVLTRRNSSVMQRWSQWNGCIIHRMQLFWLQVICDVHINTWGNHSCHVGSGYRVPNVNTLSLRCKVSYLQITLLILSILHEPQLPEPLFSIPLALLIDTPHTHTPWTIYIWGEYRFNMPKCTCLQIPCQFQWPDFTVVSGQVLKP